MMAGEGTVFIMRAVRFTPIFPMVILCGMLASCNNVYDIMDGRGDGTAGAPRAIPTDDLEMYGPEILPGRYLQTISPSSTFFNNYPSFDTRPDRILPSYTNVKVVSVKGSYVKVELIDSGAVGYVPSMMLGEKRSPHKVPVIPKNNNDQLVPEIDPGFIDPSRPAE